MKTSFGILIIKNEFLIQLKFSWFITEDEKATVRGIVTEEGLFDGTISTEIEEIYIEPVKRYFSVNDTLSPVYHTIAYRLPDVESPPRPKNCSSHNLHLGILKEIINK